MCGWWGTVTLAHIGKTLLLGELNRVADAMSSHSIGGYERVQAVLSIVIITVAAWYSDVIPDAKATDRRYIEWVRYFRVIFKNRSRVSITHSALLPPSGTLIKSTTKYMFYNKKYWYRDILLRIFKQ